MTHAQCPRDTRKVLARPSGKDVSRRRGRCQATVRQRVGVLSGRLVVNDEWKRPSCITTERRWLESCANWSQIPEIDRFLGRAQIRRNTRFRQAVGVLVRMIMESRGWKKTGRKGSLGTRAKGVPGKPAHNTGGLAFWFVRAERYELLKGTPFRSVGQRSKEVAASAPQKRKKKATRTASP